MRTKNEMGYAQKNLNKTTPGHVWTQFGVVSVGVFTTEDEFIVEHVNGCKTELHCKLTDISYPVQQLLRENEYLRAKILRFQQ